MLPASPLAPVVTGQSSTAAAEVGLTVANLLVQAGMAAAVLLLLAWLSMVVWRERMLRDVTRKFPENATELRRAARRVPLLRSPPAPTDPYARTHRVVVAPLGDGRPGEFFWGPGPRRPQEALLGPDGSRQDVLLPLAPGVHMLVVCLGRIGAQRHDHVVEPAAKRVEVQRSMVEPPAALLGPVDQVPTAAGLGWRTTVAYPEGRMLTDTHIDRDGWGFIVGVLSTSWHTRAVDALDRLLETWRWISPDEPVPPEFPLAGSRSAAPGPRDFRRCSRSSPPGRFVESVLPEAGRCPSAPTRWWTPRGGAPGLATAAGCPGHLPDGGRG